jgi:hypothetical protein
MSFSIRLENDLAAVEAGVSAPFSIEVANRNDSADRYELEIEGVDHEWVAVPVPTFGIEPHEKHSEKVFFKPPRVSESLSGNYPFVVKVRSLESGEVRTAQGVLQIKPYHHLSMEIMPKRGIFSPVRRLNEFTVTIVNLGNTEHTLQLFGSDPEDDCTYEFAHEQIAVGPGQQKQVEVVATPRSSRPFASPRLHGFTITGRSIETPAVTCSSQAQLEQRPLVTPGALIALVVIAAIAAVWVALLPKPPRIDVLAVDPAQPLVGDVITVSWRSSNANSVTILKNGLPLIERGTPEGNTQLAIEAGDLDPDGRIVFQAVAHRDRVQSEMAEARIRPTIPPELPPARIVNFTISPREVRLGQSFMIKYSVANAEGLTLMPAGIALDPKASEWMVQPTAPGTFEYYLLARDAQNRRVESERVRVSVVEGTDAAIVVFRVEPTTVDLAVSRVTVTWQLTNAVRAELLVGGQRTALPDIRGEQSVEVFRSTSFQLVGYDARGRTVSSDRIQVTVREPEPPPIDPPVTTGGATTTGGTGGATTTTTTGGATGGATGGGATTGAATGGTVPR